MIHGHATVEFAAFCLGKKCVRRYRAFHVVSFCLKCFDGRYDFFFFFVPEQTVVAGMWIKAGNAYMRVGYAELSACVDN